MLTKWQTTKFLRRNLSSCSKYVKAKCYRSLVESTSTRICSDNLGSYTNANSTKMEAVQRLAAKFCFKDYRRTSSVSSMMQDLGWEQLQARPQQNKTVMMYRMANNLVEIPATKYLTPKEYQLEATNNDYYHINALSTPTRVPSHHQWSDSGFPCQPVQCRHNLSSVLMSQGRYFDNLFLPCF